MPSNSRNENQYYGKMFESIIVSQLNQTPLEYKEDFSFDDATIKRLDREAQQVVDLLKNHTAIYTGDKTSTSSGDILLDDGTSVEIKRVSSGTGTYFNTSIFYFLKFGFDFKTTLTSPSLSEWSLSISTELSKSISFSSFGASFGTIFLLIMLLINSRFLIIVGSL